MLNLFDATVTQQVIDRINKLTAASPAIWGKMSVDQMLAHCNVTYELIYTDKHPKPNLLVGFILKWMVKNKVVSETPYPQNGPTGPQFKIEGRKDFEAESKRLIDFLTKTQKLGADHFDGKESHSFGKLNKTEWNNMLYKHLDHHLRQFGV